MLQAIADWFDSRTGFRAARKHLLDEPLPAGTGWWFVTCLLYTSPSPRDS